MAFTREFIRKTAKDSGVEIPKEMEDALVQEHLNARNAYAETQVKTYQDEHPAQDAPKVKDSQEYKDLKKEFDDYKAAQTAKETHAAKEAAYRGILKSAGISEKRIDTIIKASKDIVEALELSEDGKAKDSDKLTEKAKTEWADFISTVRTDGAQVETPPTNGGANEPDLGSMSMADYIAARKKM